MSIKEEAEMIEQQFIEYVVKQLVDKPEAVSVERVVDDRGILLKLTVDADDLGRVIGKHGATAQSLRNILRALGTKNDSHYNLRIIDVDKTDGNDAPQTETKAESTETVESVESSTSETVENESDLAKKTREELAELDDLDI